MLRITKRKVTPIHDILAALYCEVNQQLVICFVAAHKSSQTVSAARVV